MRKAIVHEVSDTPDDDGRQRCVMCGKVLAGRPEDESTTRMVIRGSQDRPGGERFWPTGKVTEIDDLLIAGDDSGSPIPHEPCVELKPA